jgi:hypothetical protein
VCFGVEYSTPIDNLATLPRSLQAQCPAHAGKSGRRVVSAFAATAFAQQTPEAASTQWRNIADQIRPKVPKLANLMVEVLISTEN